MAKFHEKIRKRKEKEKEKSKEKLKKEKQKEENQKVCFIDRMQLSSVKNPAVG